MKSRRNVEKNTTAELSSINMLLNHFKTIARIFLFALLLITILLVRSADCEASVNSILMINGVAESMRAGEDCISRMGKVVRKNKVWTENGFKTKVYSYDSGDRPTDTETIDSMIDNAFSNCANKNAIFYFFGHAGGTSSDYGLSLCNGKRAEYCYYSFSNLIRKLNGVNCKKIIVIIDCCFAGEIVSALQNSDSNINRNKFQIIASTLTDETSQVENNDRKGYSYFTRCFSNGLGYDSVEIPADKNGDQRVSMQEIVEYLVINMDAPKNKVPTQPDIYTNSLDESFFSYEFKLSEEELYLEEKDEYGLHGYFNGSKLDGKTIKWSSDNTNVVTVDNSGMVKAKKEGTAMIYAGIGKANISCSVSVGTNIKPDTEISSMYVTEKKRLSVKLYGGAIGKKVSWASNNTRVVSVDNYGNVKAHKTGYVVITASVKVNGKKTINTDWKITVLGVIEKNTDLSSMYIGESKKLSVKLFGPAKNKKVIWKSYNEKVCTVNNSGNVTAKAKGNTTIAAFIEISNISYGIGWNVSVTEAKQNILSVTNEVKGIKIKWSKASYVNGYKIYRKSGSGKWKTIKTISGSNTVSYLDEKVANGNLYTYKVRGFVGKYLTKSVKSLSAYRLTAISIKSCVSDSPGSVSLKWGKNGKATGYQIVYSTFSTFREIQSVKSTSLSRTISNLQQGKVYYFKVRPYKVENKKCYYGTYSSVKNVKVKEEASISIYPTTLKIGVGRSYTLKATVTGESKKVTWSSSNAAVATVDASGVVTGKTEGTTKIIAEANEVQAECVVTVNYLPLDGYRNNYCSVFGPFQGVSYFEYNTPVSFDDNAAYMEPYIVLEPIGKSDNKVSFRLRAWVKVEDGFTMFASCLSNMMTSTVDDVTGQTNTMQWKDKYGNAGTIRLTFKYPQLICEMTQSSWATYPYNYNLRQCKINLVNLISLAPGESSDYVRDYTMRY